VFGRACNRIDREPKNSSSKGLERSDRLGMALWTPSARASAQAASTAAKPSVSTADSTLTIVEGTADWQLDVPLPREHRVGTEVYIDMPKQPCEPRAPRRCA
jgi:hypothetical protein